MNTFCSVTCGRCDNSDDFERFTSTPVAGDLPKGHFQCPFCGLSWKIVADGEAKMLPSGFVMPPKVKVVASEGRL